MMVSQIMCEKKEEQQKKKKVMCLKKHAKTSNAILNI
jgi:hypothetical protein